MRLLVVEDNDRLAGVMIQNLEQSDFTVDRAATLETAREMLDLARYDGMVLDLGLPDGDGLNLLRKLRAERRAVPILILTARDGIDDRVQGLDLGADDYLPKPFDHQELVARLRAILRRPPNSESQVLTLGNLAFDPDSRELRIDGRVVALPLNEAGLIEILLRRSNQVVTKETLEATLLTRGGELSANAVEARIYRLRRRLETEGSDMGIHTVAGLGYLLGTGRPK